MSIITTAEAVDIGRLEATLCFNWHVVAPLSKGIVPALRGARRDYGFTSLIRSVKNVKVCGNFTTLLTTWPLLPSRSFWQTDLARFCSHLWNSIPSHNVNLIHKTKHATPNWGVGML